MEQSVWELPQVRILGRHTHAGDALTLFYTASGIECLFTGSELWLELNPMNPGSAWSSTAPGSAVFR